MLKLRCIGRILNVETKDLIAVVCTRNFKTFCTYNKDTVLSKKVKIENIDILQNNINGAIIKSICCTDCFIESLPVYSKSLISLSDITTEQLKSALMLSQCDYIAIGTVRNGYLCFSVESASLIKLKSGFIVSLLNKNAISVCNLSLSFDNKTAILIPVDPDCLSDVQKVMKAETKAEAIAASATGTKSIENDKSIKYMIDYSIDGFAIINFDDDEFRFPSDNTQDILRYMRRFVSKGAYLVGSLAASHIDFYAVSITNNYKISFSYSSSCCMFAKSSTIAEERARKHINDLNAGYLTCKKVTILSVRRDDWV